jgi:hypothetical protein
MADSAKLSTLLDDPEVRELHYGLAHVGPRSPLIPPAYDLPRDCSHCGLTEIVSGVSP